MVLPRRLTTRPSGITHTQRARVPPPDLVINDTARTCLCP
jgi:hypothetical protein